MERVAQMKQALLDHGPLWTTVCADAAFQAWHPSGAPFPGSGCATVNHAVVLVGWDDAGGAGYWLLRNSWGARWGDQGYMRIAWGANAIGRVASYLVYPSLNQVPVARAGADQVVAEGAVAALDGSASWDPDGSLQGYSWAQVAGPPVALSGANSARATFTVPPVAAETELSFRLTVTDDRGAESSAETHVTVTHEVPPAAPQVAAGGVRAGCSSSGPGAGALSALALLLYAWFRGGPFSFARPALTRGRLLAKPPG